MLTCSNDFHATAKSVIAGLNGAGFSKNDYRQKDFTELDEIMQTPKELPNKDIFEYTNDSDENSEFLSADINIENITNNTQLNIQKNDILENARNIADEYDKEVEQTSSNLDYFGDLKVNTSKIKFEVPKLPQFVKILPSNSTLFEEIKYKVLEKEDLDKDFKLADKDTQINFELTQNDIFEIDLSEDDNLPKYKKIKPGQNEYFKQYLNHKR